jgi:hypothetical protein
MNGNGAVTICGSLSMPECWSDPRVVDALRRIEATIGGMEQTDVRMSTNMRPQHEKGYILFQVTCTFRFPL